MRKTDINISPELSDDLVRASKVDLSQHDSLLLSPPEFTQLDALEALQQDLLLLQRVFVKLNGYIAQREQQQDTPDLMIIEHSKPLIQKLMVGQQMIAVLQAKAELSIVETASAQVEKALSVMGKMSGKGEGNTSKEYNQHCVVANYYSAKKKLSHLKISAAETALASIKEPALESKDQQPLTQDKIERIVGRAINLVQQQMGQDFIKRNSHLIKQGARARQSLSLLRTKGNSTGGIKKKPLLSRLSDSLRARSSGAVVESKSEVMEAAEVTGIVSDTVRRMVGESDPSLSIYLVMQGFSQQVAKEQAELKSHVVDHASVLTLYKIKSAAYKENPTPENKEKLDMVERFLVAHPGKTSLAYPGACYTNEKIDELYSMAKSKLIEASMLADKILFNAKIELSESIMTAAGKVDHDGIKREFEQLFQPYSEVEAQAVYRRRMKKAAAGEWGSTTGLEVRRRIADILQRDGFEHGGTQPNPKVDSDSSDTDVFEVGNIQSGLIVDILTALPSLAENQGSFLLDGSEQIVADFLANKSEIEQMLSESSDATMSVEQRVALEGILNQMVDAVRASIDDNPRQIDYQANAGIAPYIDFAIQQFLFKDKGAELDLTGVDDQERRAELTKQHAQAKFSGVKHEIYQAFKVTQDVRTKAVTQFFADKTQGSVTAYVSRVVEELSGDLIPAAAVPAIQARVAELDDAEMAKKIMGKASGDLSSALFNQCVNEPVVLGLIQEAETKNIVDAEPSVQAEMYTRGAHSVMHKAVADSSSRHGRDKVAAEIHPQFCYFAAVELLYKAICPEQSAEAIVKFIQEQALAADAPSATTIPRSMNQADMLTQMGETANSVTAGRFMQVESEVEAQHTAQAPEPEQEKSHEDNDSYEENFEDQFRSSKNKLG